MLTGDLLFYAHWGSIPQIHEPIEKLIPARLPILLASPTELHISGILGPVSAFFYLFGAWHIYLCIRLCSEIWAKITGIMFGVGFVASGAYHALWTLHGLVIQFSNGQTPAPIELLDVSKNYMAFVNIGVSSAIAIASIMLVAAILIGKSLYPKWMAVFAPLVPLLVGEAVLTPYAPHLGTPYSAFVTGAYYNGVMVVFFTLSLACTLRKTGIETV